MDPVSSARGLGVGMACCQIEATHFKGLVEDPDAFQWKRIPLSPTWMTYGLIETWLWKQLQRNTCCVLSRNSGLRLTMVVMTPYF